MLLFLYAAGPSKTFATHSRHLGRNQEAAANSDGASCECLCTRVPSGTRNDGSGDRGPGQHRKADNGKDHAHADAKLAEVGGEEGQGGWEEALDAGADDAVDNDPGVEAGGLLDGDEAVDEQGGDDGRGDEDVDGADAVGDKVGDDAADDADAVEDEEQVERVRVGEGRVEGVAGVGGDVEEGKVDAPEVLDTAVLARIVLFLGMERGDDIQRMRRRRKRYTRAP